MEDNVHLPAISSPGVAKKLSIAQASKYHSHPEHNTLGSNSPRLNILTSGKLLVHMPHLHQEDPQLSPNQSPGANRRIHALLSPSASRRKNPKYLDWTKSQSASSLDIPRDIAAEFHLNIGSRSSKSRSTPRILQRDTVSSRTESPLSRGSDTHANTGSAEHMASSRFRNSGSAMHTLCRGREKIDVSRNPMENTGQQTGLQKSNLASVEDHALSTRSSFQANSRTETMHPDKNDMSNEGMVLGETVEYTNQLFDKCKHWLDGVQEAKQLHNLERVVDSPVLWKD